ncbi:hypothetical protein [Sulfitobacter sp. SK011]|jgi:hypothetical protein|uniref:hypothetical protein n=1 Tax=Sulfitobacter sp. SK011 TaxID=1389004 RepID=UPI000E0A91F3|nr:hypothetical protein [Sulfitobacter sp. SK011]AXI42765.1 hypothetical protein C1J02_13055 [Sulfitobacter sp. SK011]
MRSNQQSGQFRWDHAASLMPVGGAAQQCPQGALVPDLLHDCDQVAVVYDKGQTPPEITIMQVSGFVHTVLADGIAVAVVACTSGPAPSAENVLLVERSS